MTPAFLVFVLLAAAGHVATRNNRKAWQVTAILSSGAFLAYADWTLVLMYAVVTLWVWWWVRRIASRHALKLFVAGLVGVLVVSRYTLFAFDTAATLGWSGWTPDSWWAPLGISFIVFQSIMVGVDRRRGSLERDPTLAETALLLGLFPKALAGPLMRPSDFLAQMAIWPRPVYSTAAISTLVISGLFKKVVVGATLYEYQVATARPDSLSGAESLLRLFVGPLRVFCDVSAYADLAVAGGMLIGVVLPANFNRPFAARNLAGYWSRWHITVTRFFGEYLFETLRGTRGAGRAKVVAAAIGTMAISGLWHGAAWSFALWGALHGAALAGEALFRFAAADRRMAARRRGERVIKAAPGRLRTVLSTVGTYVFVATTGVLFADVPLSLAVQRVAGVLRPWDSFTFIDVAVLIAAAAAISTQIEASRLRAGVREAFARLPSAGHVAATAVAVTVIFGLAPAGVPGFLYFGF